MAQRLLAVREAVAKDGNCQYTGLAVQCAGWTAASLRAAVVEALGQDAERRATYAPDIDDPRAPPSYDDYIAAQAQSGVYGDGATLRVAAEVLGAQVWVLGTTDRLHLGRVGSGDKVICLTWRPFHYDVLRIPLTLARELAASTTNRWKLPTATPTPPPVAPTATAATTISPIRGPAPRPPSRRPAPRPASPGVLRVASANVTSLSTHLCDVADLKADVVALQETRVPDPSKGTLSSYFAAHGWSMHWGKGMPKVKGANGYEQTRPGGVAVMAKEGLVAQVVQPKTKLEKKLHDSTRLVHVVLATSNGKTALHILCVYGHSGMEVRVQRETLLQEALDLAAGLGQVPVLLLGDLNTNPETSAVLSQACRVGGWTDAAVSYAELKQQEVRNTCWASKEGTRLDICLLNPCAAPALRSVEVAEKGEYGIPTHCPLFVDLDLAAFRRPKQICILPAPFPKCKPTLGGAAAREVLLDVLTAEKTKKGATGAQLLRRASACSENFLKRVHVGQLGRQEAAYTGRAEGYHMQQSRVATKHRPASARGAGDKNTRAKDKLLGNLRTLILEGRHRLLESAPYPPTPNEEHAWDAAKKRLKGGGLPPGLEAALAGTTSQLPDLETMEMALVALEGSQRGMFDALRDERLRTWKARMQKAWTQEAGIVFSYLADRFCAPTTFMRREDGSFTACPKEADELLRSDTAWGGYFRKYATTPEPRWDTFRQRYSDFLPDPAEMECKTITAEDVGTALAKMSTSTSPGLHGWRVHELRQLPGDLLKLFAEVFNEVERSGEWPEQLMHAMICLIPKPGSSGEPLSQRPISITPVLYRVWAAIRVKPALKWLESIAPEDLHGCRPGHGAEDLIWHLAARIEEAHLTGQPLYGVALDFKKCFDTVPIDLTFCLAAELGFDGRVLRTLRAAYGSMQRHFRVSGTIGEGFLPTNGIMQGCPISVVLINVLVGVWMRMAEHRQGTRALSFVDDVYAVTPSPGTLQAVVDDSADFSHDTGMVICAEVKSHVFSTSPEPLTPIVYRTRDGTATPLRQRDSFDCLGAMLHARPLEGPEVPKSERVARRKEGAEQNLRRTSALPLPVQWKGQAAAMTAGSRLYYDALVTRWEDADIRRWRGLFVAALWSGPPRRAREAVLDVLHHAHRVDPAVAPRYRQITTWAMQVKKWGRCRVLSETAWDSRVRLTGTGPFALFRAALRWIGWSWSTATTLSYTDEAGRSIVFDPTAATTSGWGIFAHDLRQALRTQVAKALAGRRDDFAGAQHGIDGQATRCVLEGEGAAVTGYQRGLLRSVIAGAVPVRGRTGQGGICRYCNAGTPETVMHLWWECSAWDPIRQNHPITAVDRSTWPPCLALCGVAPAFRHGIPEDRQPLPLSFARRVDIVAQLHRYFIAILSARQEKDGLLDRSARHHRTLHYPWGWCTPNPERACIPVRAPSTVKQTWGKRPPELWVALCDWLRGLKWGPQGGEHTVTLMELAVDFELSTGLTLPEVETRRIRPHTPDPPERGPREARPRIPEDTAPGLTLYFDGGARDNGTPFALAGAGAVLYRDGLKVSEEILPLLNVRSNNIAEYEGVRAGLRLLRRGDPPPEGNVTVRGDSQVVLRHLKGEAVCRDKSLRPLFLSTARLAADLGPRITLTYEHVKRELNVDADALSNAAMDEAERQGETSQEQLRQDFAAFQKSILGKAHSLRQLCEVVRKTSKQPWHCGHTASSTVLTAIGGTVAGGLSRRAQLSPATESVMRSLQAHTAGPGLNQRDTAFHSRGMAWAATFAPQPHYPEGWQQAAQQWTASSRQANARTGRSWERRGAAPRTAPPGARRNAKMLTCALHWKPRCVDCRRRRLSEEDCCRDHHGKNDGLQVTMEFCKTHRMGRCGDCHSSAKSLTHCCGTHHAGYASRPPRSGTELAPHSNPSGASAVT